MQKSQNKKHNILYSVCASLFIYGYCSTVTFGAPSVDYIQSQINKHDINIHTQNILSTIFQPKSKASFNDSNTASTEIWGRVRSRLNLGQAQTGQPLLQRHIRSFSQHQDYINKVIKNASPYFFYILEEVERRGMPSEIALLPIIESDFNPHTLSNKGAVGLWQLMPTLGRIHGLKQNASYDGRKDVYESTKVALDHLQYLHKRFNGNWLLAIAAYNCGEGRLQQAMRQNKSARKSTDFWALKLPKETTHFVPKLLAFAAIVKSPKQYGVVLPAIPNKPVITRINTGKPIDIAHAAKLVDISETQLRRLNPGHKKSSTNGAPFHLVVPIHHADTFKKKVPSTTVTQKAASTSSSTKETGKVKASTKETAKVKATTTQAKTKSSKSASSDVSVVSKAKGAGTSKAKVVHVVKRGESIPKICKKYKVKVSTVLANNNLKYSSIIQPGQRIVIKAG